MWDYTEKVKEHFFNPRNVGEVENPDGVGEVGSLACGDALRLTFKLDKNGRIEEAKFKTFGCGSAIASSSALTELIKGMTVEEAEKVSNQNIAEYLGGLPEQKMHCSVMGREALEAAIAYYRGEEFTPHHLEGNVVCTCYGVTDHEIERVVRDNNLKTVEQVTNYCKAGGGCGGCIPDIEEIINKIEDEKLQQAKEAKPVEQPKKPLTNLEKIKLIEKTLNEEVRPALQADGGDIDLIDVNGNKVIISFRGTCSKCKVAGFTMTEVIQKPLREFVSPDIVVEEQKV